MGQVILDQSVLSALEIEKLNFSSLFDIYFHCKGGPSDLGAKILQKY